MSKQLTAAFAATLPLLLTLLTPAPAYAQDAGTTTQPGTIDSKADQPTSAAGQTTDQPEPSGITGKVRSYVEKNRIVERFEGDGVYPRIGGMGPGAGFTAGAGYRRHVDWAYFDVSALISTKSYRGIDARARWVETSDKKFELWTNLKFRNNTQDDYYGLGLESTNAQRTNFGIRSTDVVALAITHFRPWLQIGADVGYYMPSVRHGRDDSLPSIELTFTDVTAPGLARQPDFLHNRVFAEIDSRDAHGFTRRGGIYRASYGIWNDRTFNQFDFSRFDIEGSQFLSITPKDVVAMRLALSYANNKPGERVPFYLLPYVGGGDTVRAFREFRFRDENAGVFNIELRRQVHKFVHLAAFVDVGKVANDWQGINPKDTKKAYGFGARGGTDKQSFVRMDVAFGNEGTRVFLKFSGAF